jgi:hypothetical protein
MTDKAFDGTAMRLVRRAIATNGFRLFTEADWSSYSGAHGESPLIAEIDDAVIVADDQGFSVFTYG